MTIRKYVTEQGNLDPVALRVEIESSDVVTDLTLVTAVSLSCTDRRAGTAETWTTTTVSQAEALLVVQHLYQLADTATPRTLRITPWMTVTGAANPVAATTFDLQIEARP
jgi:hypothetical protein